MGSAVDRAHPSVIAAVAGHDPRVPIRSLGECLNLLARWIDAERDTYRRAIVALRERDARIRQLEHELCAALNDAAALRAAIRLGCVELVLERAAP